MTDYGNFTRHFGDELRRHRERLGWSREDLAERLPWSVWTITSIEQARRKPPHGLGEHTDALFGLPGVMTALSEKAQNDRTPFGDLVDYEQRATSIGVYDMRVVPGLLQTEAYARATQQTRGRALPAEEIERFVRIRMERQQILTREHPPTLHTVIDEATLIRWIGDREIMREQLLALSAPRLNVITQVLPLCAGTHDALPGPITIMRLPDEPDIAFADGWAHGEVLDTVEEVIRAQRTFEQLAALALPPEISREMILDYAEEL